MTFAKRPAAAILVSLVAALSGCGESTAPSIPASSHLEPHRGDPAGQIVLSQLGAKQIGIQTVRVGAVPTRPGKKTRKTTGGPVVIIPYSAVIYDPSGKSYAFANTGRLTYVEIPITVDRVSGNAAYLLKGPKAGSMVVSVGAEELYGVQTGVLAQT